MIRYVITDNDKETKALTWGKDGLDCWCKKGKKLDLISYTPDESKELAAFIMAQVKE